MVLQISIKKEGHTKRNEYHINLTIIKLDIAFTKWDGKTTTFFLLKTYSHSRSHFKHVGTLIFIFSDYFLYAHMFKLADMH